MLMHITIFIVVGDKMAKADKKDDKRADKRMEKVPERRIYLDDDEPSAKAIELTPKSIKKPSYDDVKLKDIIERAKENDPNKNKPAQAVPTPGPIFPPYAASQKYTTATSTLASKEETQKDKGDGIRIFMFIGVIIGFVILLTLFGGPFSPLALLGSIVGANPTADATKTITPIVIPVEKPSEPAPVVNDEPTNPVLKTKDVDIVISNWRMQPDTIKIKAGEPVNLKVISIEMPFDIRIEGLDIKDYVEPGKTTTITINASPGQYMISAIAWNAGRMTSANAVLIAE